MVVWRSHGGSLYSMFFYLDELIKSYIFYVTYNINIYIQRTEHLLFQTKYLDFTLVGPKLICRKASKLWLALDGTTVPASPREKL